MKRVFRKLKRANRFSRYLFFILSIAYIVSFVFFAKNIINLTGIETVIRYIGLVLCLFYFFFYLYFGLARLTKRKYGLFYLVSLFTILLIAIFVLASFFIDLVIGKISSFKENDKILYTSYLITLNDTQLNSKSTLGMIDDDDNIEGNILAKKIIKDNDLKQEIVKYDDEESDAFISMLYDLYDKKIDGVFISSNYVTLYSGEDELSNLANETKVVYQASKKFKNTDADLASNKSLTEPFTVLVMGVDSEYDGLDANAAFNGDTLILATFNPKTFSATLLSIPRDTYVPIACRNGAQSKINSSAAYGSSCVIDTIEDLTDVSIDYYVKINFKGVVDLVEAVGGVTVNVEKPDFQFNHTVNCGGKVCEQNSDRQWGSHTVYINPGMQTLNGEQALAYARCRALYAESDLARNRHQQDIIMAIARQTLKINNYNKFKKVLDAISKNIATNMSTNQILSSYKIFKDMVGKALKNEEFIDIQKLKLETYSLPVYIPSAGMTTSALGYYKDSLEDVSRAMKVNLGIEEAELIKTFSYDLNEDYVVKAAGEGLKSGSSNTTISSMVGQSKATAESYCSEYGFTCEFTYVDDTSSYYDASIEPDLIASQSPSAGVLASDVSSITFYINGAKAEDDD